MQLTKGMFKGESDEARAKFGIHDGQICGRDLVHNGGWYNRRGEDLGWGDLSPENLRQIATAVEDGDPFIILNEPDMSRVGGFTRDQLSPSEVAEHARFIIARGRLIYVDQYAQLSPGQEIQRTREHDGLTFEVMTPEEAKRFILGQ